MQVINGLQLVTTPPSNGTALTIGSFDGLHLGHRALVGEVLRNAQKHQILPAMLTFDPHPLQVLQPQTPVRRLFPVIDLQEQAEAMGVQWLVVEPFTLQLAQMEPEEYWLTRVKPALRPKVVVVGHDFGFGADRKGNLEFLRQLAGREGFELHVVPPVTLASGVISSSRIRALLIEGKVELVSSLLGRPFAVRGQVVRGDGRGQSLGFRTANLARLPTTMPATGVYVTETWVPSGQWVPSITNVGSAPTVRHPNSDLRLETHLLAKGEWPLYNETIVVKFHARLREETQFAGIGELKSQIARDIEEAKAYWDRKKKSAGPKSP